MRTLPVNPLTTWIPGGIILLVIGLWNGYPLVYSDTGTYIYSAADLFVPNDRPVGYGIWIRLTSGMKSLWFTIILQNLLTAWVMWKVVKSGFFKRPLTAYLTAMVVVMTYTGLPWYTNQIMPDFWAPLLFLSLFLLLFDENLTWIERVFLALVVAMAGWVHFSHLLMLGSACAALTLVVWLRPQWLEVQRRQLYLPWALALVVWAAYPIGNYLVDGTRVTSKGSHVFFMAHLAEAGIMQAFLDANCAKPEYAHLKLCENKDNLPQDIVHFLWLPGNIFELTGGWEESKPEFDPIIKGTFTQPRFLWMNLKTSFRYGILQLGENTIGQGLSAYGIGAPPHQQVEWRFNHEEQQYLQARQQQAGYSFAYINPFINVYMVLCLLLLGITFPWWRRQRALQVLVPFLLLAIVLNSFITAGLSAPLDRYQARMSWMIPFLAVLVLFIPFRKAKMP